MNKNSKPNYVCIVKWRMGEYQALERLSDEIKGRVTPLITLEKEKWDYEKNQPSKSLEDHLASFGKRLKAKWADRICYVDTIQIDDDAQMEDGTHHLERVFDLARKSGASPIPTISMSRSIGYVQAVKRIVSLDKRGVCIRLSSPDFNENFAYKLTKLCKAIGVDAASTHLIVDTSDEKIGDKVELAECWKVFLGQIPDIQSWANVVVAGGSFPQYLPADTFRPAGKASRIEWLAYKHLITKSKGQLIRIPIFGDYACASPRAENLDMRFIDPNAKIKYTIDDSWHIQVGKQVRKNGRGQYKDLCESIVNDKSISFRGQEYSYGDAFVFECSKGGNTGGPSTWPTVASNHHITMVAHDLANFHDASNNL